MLTTHRRLALLALPLLAACGTSAAPTVGTGTSNGTTPSAAPSGGLPGCPKAAVINAAAGATYSGPSTAVSAACTYSGTAGDINVLYDSPQESLSAWKSATPGNIGQPAQAVSGFGQGAFTTMTYGHAEIDIYVSPSEELGVTLDPANGAAVTTEDLLIVEKVATALLG